MPSKDSFEEIICFNPSNYQWITNRDWTFQASIRILEFTSLLNSYYSFALGTSQNLNWYSLKIFNFSEIITAATGSLNQCDEWIKQFFEKIWLKKQMTLSYAIIWLQKWGLKKRPNLSCYSQKMFTSSLALLGEREVPMRHSWTNHSFWIRSFWLTIWVIEPVMNELFTKWPDNSYVQVTDAMITYPWC